MQRLGFLTIGQLVCAWVWIIGGIALDCWAGIVRDLPLAGVSLLLLGGGLLMRYRAVSYHPEM